MSTDPDLRQNAGRCDICGSIVNMEDGDRLTCIDNSETPPGAREAIADMIEQMGETGADYELARLLREREAINVHSSCLEKTPYTDLESEVPDS